MAVTDLSSIDTLDGFVASTAWPTVDATGAPQWAAYSPSATAVDLWFASGLTLDFTLPGGEPVHLALDLDHVALPVPGGNLGGQPVVQLGAPGWLRPVVDHAQANGTADVAPGDPLHDVVRAALLADSAVVWID